MFPKFVKLIKVLSCEQNSIHVIVYVLYRNEAYREGLTFVYQISMVIWPTEMQCNCIEKIITGIKYFVKL